MFWGFIFVLAGAGMLLQSLGYLPANVSIFWPIILIAIGLSIIFKRRNYDWFYNDSCSCRNDKDQR